MTQLNEWAQRWRVPYAALEDLRAMMGAVNTDPQPGRLGNSEAAVTNAVRLEASRKGLRLWRNNVGAARDENGNYFRFGLANDSPQMNRVIKSSDLIGIRPVVIGPHHVGSILGQFVARELKAAGWRYSASDREQAQLRFIELVQSMGGDAAFCNGEGSL